MTQKGLILNNEDFNSMGKIETKSAYQLYLESTRPNQMVVEQNLLIDGLKNIKSYFSKTDKEKDKEPKPMTKIIQAGDDFKFKVDSKNNPQYFTEELETKRIEEQNRTFQRNKIK